jgi:Pyridoxamine 5'-phosphate oxidase
MLLPLAAEPYTAPTDRDMLPSERREFVRTHRTCVFGYRRRNDGPAMSVVYYIPTDTDELLVSTMAGRGKARVIERDGKVSLCVLDERWPFSYLQVYADATLEQDRDFAIDVMMACRSNVRPTSRRGSAPPRSSDGRAGKPRRRPLSALRQLCNPAAPPAPQRSSRPIDPLGVGCGRLGRRRSGDGLITYCPA